MVPTIYDIAKACNCSTATVSKVLNGKGDISKQKSADIIAKANELGYIPSSSARHLALSKKTSGLIGVILHIQEEKSITHELFSSILNSFRISVEKKGFETVLVSEIKESSSFSYINKANSRGYDGIFILSCRFDNKKIQELLKSNIPLVIFDSNNGQHTVTSNNKESVAQLVDHLVNLGHQNIVYVQPGTQEITMERLDGFKIGLERNNIKFNESMVVPGTYFSHNAAEICTKAALESPIKPTVIMYPDDYTAYASIPVLKKLGYRIPQDIQITGYDGIALAELMQPSLTTIKQNSNEIGLAAAKLLLTQIEEKPVKQTHVTVNTTIIHGNSTKKIN